MSEIKFKYQCCKNRNPDPDQIGVKNSNSDPQY